MNSDDGYESTSSAYTVNAIPNSASAQGPLFTSSKTINPCQLEANEGILNFNLSLEKVAPRQTIDVNVKGK